MSGWIYKLFFFFFCVPKCNAKLINIYEWIYWTEKQALISSVIMAKMQNINTRPTLLKEDFNVCSFSYFHSLFTLL